MKKVAYKIKRINKISGCLDVSIEIGNSLDQILKNIDLNYRYILSIEIFDIPIKEHSGDEFNNIFGISY